MPGFKFVLVLAIVVGSGFTSEFEFGRVRAPGTVRVGDDKKLASLLRPSQFLFLGCA